jgi:hypothetical protein
MPLTSPTQLETFFYLSQYLSQFIHRSSIATQMRNLFKEAIKNAYYLYLYDKYQKNGLLSLAPIGTNNSPKFACKIQMAEEILKRGIESVKRCRERKSSPVTTEELNQHLFLIAYTGEQPSYSYSLSSQSPTDFPFPLY